MNKRSVFLVVVLFIVGTSLFAQATSNPVLVTVEGQPITRDELYQAFVQLYPQQANDVLNRLVNEILVLNEAKRRKVDVSEQEVKSRATELGITDELSALLHRMIKSTLLAEKLIIAEKKLKVTDDEVKKFFEENRSQLGEPEQVRLKQILVLSETEANDVLLALQAGADFSKMATLKSQDTISREKGGDLGFFSRGMLVPEIEKVVFDMKQGEVSSPIRTAAGFHIIKVEEKRPFKEAKLDAEMKRRLERLILNNKIQQELPRWVDGLRQKATIR